MEHRVTFLSHGTDFPDSTIKPIDSWSIWLAVDMAAVDDDEPYGFFFSTLVDGRVTECSGMHYIGGTVLDLAAAEAQTGCEVFVGHMRRFGLPFAIKELGGHMHYAAFGDRDVVVDASGAIVERGDSPERTAVREKVAQ